MKLIQTSQLTGQSLSMGVPFKVGGYEITFMGYEKFSGFQVSRDPGNFLIWIASILFLFGLVIVFYFPRSNIWIFFQSGLTGQLGNNLSSCGLTGEDQIFLQIFRNWFLNLTRSYQYRKNL